MYTTLEQIKKDTLEKMSASEREEFDRAYVESDIRIHIAEIVYSLRQEAGLSQTALAKKIGSAQSVISSIENGASTADISTLQRIANVLGATLNIDMKPIKAAH